MKKYIIILCMPIIIFLLLMITLRSDLNPNYHNYRIDKKAWSEMSTLFTEDNVSKVIIHNKKNFELTKDQKDEFTRALGAAKFEKSNWKSAGSKADIVITITFKDNIEVNFSYWGLSRFETSYNNRQFLILSYDIATLLHKYNVYD